MMPKRILDMSSLQENSEGNIKYAISIITEISKDTYLPINVVNLKYTIIKVSNKNALTYTTENNDVINIGLKISNALRIQRNSLGSKLGNLNRSNIYYIHEIPMLKKNKENTIKKKQMIAEFAIFANSFVGKFLTYHLNGLGIFRTCDTNGWIDNINKNISGDELMNQIIDNGISANYLSKVTPHDLVGIPEYCHFTSPIRRVADCVCHYLLKYIYLRKYIDINCPFTHEELNNIAKRCFIISKKERKKQFNDVKFRIFQTLYHMCLTTPVLIDIKFLSYSGLFINFMITKIEEHNTSVSYSLKIKNYKYTDIWKETPNRSLHISQINPINKFDEGTLPELDHFIHNMIYKNIYLENIDLI